MLCLFVNVLTAATLLRVWDALLAAADLNALIAAALVPLRRYEARLRASEDIAGVYATLVQVTPAMWDSDALMLEMKDVVTKVDPSGERRAALQRDRDVPSIS